MKRKRILAMMLAVAVGIGVLAGCGSSDSSSADDTTETQQSEEAEDTEDAEEDSEDAGTQETVLDLSEEVEIIMYVVSDRPAGQDVVDENLNTLLKEKLNLSSRKFFSLHLRCLNG